MFRPLVQEFDGSLVMAVGIGMEVYFKSHVYEAPFAPFYDNYKGHKFKVIKLHHGNHIELQCVTGDVEVNGYVHAEDLKRA